MTTDFIKKYRRKSDNRIYTAVQYGNEDLTWDIQCMPRVAQFVLGVDVESRVNVGNEWVMDAVQPVTDRWTPEHMVADILVADWVRGTNYQVRLGDWLVKDEDEQLLHIGLGDFRNDFVLLIEELVERTPVEELSELIYAHFPWQGELYKKTARRIATTAVNSGWIKP